MGLDQWKTLWPRVSISFQRLLEGTPRIILFCWRCWYIESISSVMAETLLSLCKRIEMVWTATCSDLWQSLTPRDPSTWTGDSLSSITFRMTRLLSLNHLKETQVSTLFWTFLVCDYYCVYMHVFERYLVNSEGYRLQLDSMVDFCGLLKDIEERGSLQSNFVAEHEPYRRLFSFHVI